MKNISILFSILFLTLLAACGAISTPVATLVVLPSPAVATSTQPAILPETTLTLTEEFTVPPTQSEPTPTPEAISVAAQNLQTPWEIVFLPDGRMLVTERPGTLTLIDAGGLRIPIADAFERGESGLLGLALHPDF